MKAFILFLCLLVTLNISYAISEDYITIKKGNVTHNFVRVNKGWVDTFTQSVFEDWENDTFEIFEKVKNKDGIALDIGAWIGTTAIWLSQNFQHVIAVEADIESIDVLKKNLAASNCTNVTICEKAITSDGMNVYFGPRLTRGNALNNSTSTAKKCRDSNFDYVTQSATLNQIINEYLKSNNAISERKITFIKCDIEGGEEDIFEDVLEYALNNNVKVWMSFHISWWKSKKITDFSELLANFNTNIPNNDIISYLKEDPFGSVLLEPTQLTNTKTAYR